MGDYGDHSLVTAPLFAGSELVGTVSFWRSRPREPFAQDEISFAAELAAKAATAIDNAYRYSRERSTALTLQRSLLPQRIPRQAAVEAAFRYLPAAQQAGVGGDWFDVILLSGTRVALVVGDVIGHGIHAAATMGRLRTAVRTLADIDLRPDELLTRLDDLVVHLTADSRPEATDMGATCLYAVYDPVARHCTLAAAGHPLPALTTPEGTAKIISGNIGPPLGVGGLPFETTEFDLEPGSVLALYTDGLIESRDRDIDTILDELCRALQQPAPTLDDACDTVINTLLTERSTDDVALLLARTRALAPDSIATWDIADDPAQVEHARRLVADQLRAWGLEQAVRTTELVASELVTNAIHYGDPPIQLRLIRDSTLTCEVSDAGTTAPHRRRADPDDEGGRGLLLVARLTDRWGTRHLSTGKTVWCEQALSPH
jgi:serine phosphatase RsbU (regulator of sigma subunit)/anti-sigma regulatory factor (Ser/Thr protein kinase)